MGIISGQLAKVCKLTDRVPGVVDMSRVASPSPSHPAAPADNISLANQPRPL